MVDSPSINDLQSPASNSVIPFIGQKDKSTPESSLPPLRMWVRSTPVGIKIRCMQNIMNQSTCMKSALRQQDRTYTITRNATVNKRPGASNGWS
jgi:hypothetical protein